MPISGMSSNYRHSSQKKNSWITVHFWYYCVTMADIDGTLFILFAIPVIVPSVNPRVHVVRWFWLVVLCYLYFSTGADFGILIFPTILMVPSS